MQLVERNNPFVSSPTASKLDKRFRKEYTSHPSLNYFSEGNKRNSTLQSCSCESKRVPSVSTSVLITRCSLSLARAQKFRKARILRSSKTTSESKPPSFLGGVPQLFARKDDQQQVRAILSTGRHSVRCPTDCHTL